MYVYLCICNPKLYRYFILQYEAMARANNKTIVHWEDVFDHFGWDLPKDVVIHVYYTHTSAQNAIKGTFYVLVHIQLDSE